MKTKVRTKKSRVEVPFDPVLCEATVPVRKATPKDLQDCEEHKDDVIEPQEYESMGDIARDL